MRGPILLLAAMLSGCGFLAPSDDNRASTMEELAGEEGWDADAFIVADFGLEAAAARVRDGTLEFIGLVLQGSDWYTTLDDRKPGIGGSNTFFISSGRRTGTWMYGSAESGVAEVVTDAPGAVGGIVVDGAWVVWSPDPSLAEADEIVSWQFVAEDGSVLDEGSGSEPPHP